MDNKPKDPRPSLPVANYSSAIARAVDWLVSCPTNTLHDPPADFSVGQGAPTSHSGHYGEEAQRRPAPSGSPRGTRRSE